MSQDGYAVRHGDGAGEYEVELDALAGAAPGRLCPGKVAYIGTGLCASQTATMHALPAFTHAQRRRACP